MSRLMTTDPFESEFRNFFRGLMRPGRLWPTATLEGDFVAEVRVDVKENDKAFTVHAELPGVKKEDIDVSIDGNVVTISAEVKREKEQKDEKTVRSERYYGAISRSFSLSSEVDEKTANASYSDGVLELTLPKKGNGKVKHLQVK
jgi:HSP20 family protein